MFSEKHYVPVLKGKQGELGAIGEFLQAEKTNFTPLWELLLADDSRNKIKKPTAERLTKSAKELASKWGETHPIFVDPLFLDHGLKLPGGELPFLAWANAAIESKLNFIPTTGIGRPIKEHQAIKSLIGDWGLCLRLQMEDLEHEDWQEDLEELLAYFEVKPKQVHLVLDLDTIPALPSTAYISGVAALIKMIPFLDKWITFTVVAGSFPESLAGFERDDISKAPRREWNAWLALCKTLGRKPTFGDYAIANPRLPDVDPQQMRPSAAIRYTVKDGWLVVKGRGAAKHGYEQFHVLSSKLVRHHEYMKPVFSWGDNYIHQCARKAVGTGNLTTWRKVGTNHHIKFVTHQLASLGGF